MNVIGWIILIIIGLNLAAFGIMWWIFIREEKQKRKHGGKTAEE